MPCVRHCSLKRACIPQLKNHGVLLTWVLSYLFYLKDNIMKRKSGYPWLVIMYFLPNDTHKAFHFYLIIYSKEGRIIVSVFWHHLELFAIYLWSSEWMDLQGWSWLIACRCRSIIHTIFGFGTFCGRHSVLIILWCPFGIPKGSVWKTFNAFRSQQTWLALWRPHFQNLLFCLKFLSSRNCHQTSQYPNFC